MNFELTNPVNIEFKKNHATQNVAEWRVRQSAYAQMFMLYPDLITIYK